jgi:hypothetical protein
MGRLNCFLGSTFGSVGASTLALLAPLSAAGAQPVPQQQPIPPTREEIERPARDREQRPRPRLVIEGDIERAPCALDRPENQNIRFTPTEVVFEDLRGLPAEALGQAYAEYLGQEQPISVICEIRDRAATILRNAGYVASVEVPEQRVAGRPFALQGADGALGSNSRARRCWSLRASDCRLPSTAYRGSSFQSLRRRAVPPAGGGPSRLLGPPGATFRRPGTRRSDRGGNGAADPRSCRG